MFSKIITLVLLSVSACLALPSELVARDTTSAVTSAAGLTWYNPSLTAGSKGRTNPSSYICFTGAAANFPPRSSWMSFDAMWALNKADSLVPIKDTAAEITAIYNAILSISKISKVDARVILGVIIQESTGNVRAPCTNNGVSNCGLMQSYNSTNRYDPKNMQKTITAMIVDGVQGTKSGPGLVQYFMDAKGTAGPTGGNLYKTLRMYNSGKLDANNLSKGLGARNSYVSDVGNRLQGWNGWGDGGAKCKW